MKKLVLAYTAFFLPALAFAQTTGLPTPNTAPLTAYTSTLQGFINGALVPTLIALAFIIFLWGVANAYILHPGDEGKRAEGHQFILWGIIGFVVIFSVWGLVNLVGSVLGLGAGGVGPRPPGINTGTTNTTNTVAPSPTPSSPVNTQNAPIGA